MDNIKTMRILDLFAGTGAFSLAFHSSSNHKVKYTTVMANDYEKASETIYKENFPQENFVLGDINTIDVSSIPTHDILCGGFPCQPFSIAGHQEGFNDERSNVFWKILEILKNHKPGIIILENVKNLTTHDNKNTYRTITTKLEELGYKLRAKVLDTSRITNVPQHRERIYIVGFLDEEHYNRFSMDFPDVEVDKISTLLEKIEIDEKYYYTDRFVVYNTVSEGVTKDISKNVLYQLRRQYVRENKSNLCPTMTANMGGGGHNVPLLKDQNGIRKLTPRECFNLQGFPPDYKLPSTLSDSALYKLAGNAVSVPVVKTLVQRLSETM